MTLKQARLAVVGSGAMAEAILAGLLSKQLVDPGRVVASHPRAERREYLQKTYGIKVEASNTDAVKDADIVLLAIKPQMLAKVMPELSLKPKQLLVSIVAGASTQVLSTGFSHSAIVRAMPNTPAQIGRGITVWFATPAVDAPAKAQVEELLGALGTQLEVEDERQVAMATAVSGTGPTYVFLFIEALVDAAVQLGFPRHIARELVLETVQGSADFAMQSGKHVAELRDMVTSPGGTSAAALYELEKGRMRTVLSDAVKAAFARTLELETNLQDNPAK